MTLYPFLTNAVGVKEKPVSYLLEILHLLLASMGGIRLIELQNAQDPSLKLQSDLELLSALFKQCK